MVPASVQNVTVNIGNVLVGEITGLKFNDLNGNGIREVTEPGYAGQQLDLYTVPGNVFIQRVVSGAGGVERAAGGRP